MATLHVLADPDRDDALDQGLVADFQRGNSHALAELYRRHKRRVASVARNLLGPSDELEDVVHEVFIEVHRSLGRFRGEARFTTWLHRVTVNVALMHLRRGRRRGWLRWLGLDQAPTQALPRAPALELQSEARETLAALYAELGEIGDKKRVAFTLYELEGLSLDEIAGVTGASLNTVKSRLHHARREVFAGLERRGLLPEPTARTER